MARAFERSHARLPPERAPDLVEAILEGTHPVALTPERLTRAGELPLLWEEQRAMLGVDEPEGGDLRRISGARVHLPPDANTLLVIADECLRSTD